jgi:hypothetical protein
VRHLNLHLDETVLQLYGTDQFWWGLRPAETLVG